VQVVELGEIRLEVSGHTDNQGSADLNRRLSTERAEAVKSYLEANGVAPERLEARGFGPDKPVADNRTAAGRSKNRRIEFRLLE
jgi:outer membrane protein OmpA-like peptidoglycan-associated protein